MPVVAVIPAEAEAAARPQDAVDLRQRLLELEPVDARAGDDRIGDAVPEGDRLGRAFHALLAQLAQDRQHPRVRLDRDDPHAELGHGPVSFPVPAPSSTTSSAPSGTSQRAASSGHAGRARS